MRTVKEIKAVMNNPSLDKNQILQIQRDCDIHSLEIKELIEEYDFVSKQLYQMDY